MRVSCALNEAIKQHCHFISFDLIFTHYLEQLISPVLKEEHLRLQWVTVQKLVPNLSECFYHQLKYVSAVRVYIPL